MTTEKKSKVAEEKIVRSSIDESRVSDKWGQWLFVPKKVEHYENPLPL